MRASSIVLALCLVAAPMPTWAQRDDTRPATPYEPVPVNIPAQPQPDGLDAFRAQLAALGVERDSGALEALVAAKGFFWETDGDQDGLDPAKSAHANFSAALGFDIDEGNAGWSNLARLVTYPAVAHPRRRGVLCAPSLPRYDEKAFDALLAKTESEASAWAATRAAGLQVRLYPRDDGRVIETLGLHLVLIDGSEDPTATDTRTWSLVMTPKGKRGYVLASDLVALDGDHLCYSKDAAGAWRIIGYIGDLGSD